MDYDLYQRQQLQPDQVKYWEIAKSQDQQNFIDNLERQLLDLQYQKKEQEDQAVKTIELYQKTIEEKNNLLDQYLAEKNQIKSRQINVTSHVDNINSLSLQVKRLKSELRQKNDRIFQLEKKVQQLEEDYNFDIKLLNNKRNYEKALTYKLMQSQVVVENTSLKLINQGLEKQISELNRKLLLLENESKANKQSLRTLQVNAAARKQQQQLNYEDRIRIEKMLKGLDDEEINNEKIVEVFKDEMLLQGVVEIFTRMRKMIVRNLNRQFVKSNRLSQKGELNSVIAFKDIIYSHVSKKKDEEISSYLLLYRQFKELIQQYYPDYGKIIFYRQQQQQQSEEELKSLQSTDQVNDKINQSIQVIQERDEINNWLLSNLMILKQKRKQEKYNLRRDEQQLNRKIETDQILFYSRQLFQYLALYLRLKHINQRKDDQDNTIAEGKNIDNDDQDTKVDIDQDLQINLEESIVIQYYRLLQVIIKL